MTQLYRIEELCTTGWVVIEPHQTKLTKEQCKEQLDIYLAQGYNPNDLRVAPDND